MKHYYSYVRIIFGLFLFQHFVMLIPYGAEVFSNIGVIPNGADSPLLFAFPNILALFDSPMFVTFFLSIGAGASLLFTIGRWDRTAAFLLWYIFACLFGRNPLIANPALPYLGWMLLAHIFIPKNSKEVPLGIFTCAWILLAVGYSYSGITKLWSPSWVDGTALIHVLECPLARPGFLRDFVLSLPLPLLHYLTWGALAGELFFAPLALFKRTRPWIWSIMLVMHIGLIILIDFVEISFGMILIHLFTFDPEWIAVNSTKEENNLPTI